MVQLFEQILVKCYFVSSSVHFVARTVALIKWFKAKSFAFRGKIALSNRSFIFVLCIFTIESSNLLHFQTIAVFENLTELIMENSRAHIDTRHFYYTKKK
jgi:hypothetical protein